MGEVRGKEALELLNSYNTGHDGGMSSGHGNSPKDMLARLETMVLMGADLPLAAIRSQIASALDILIHLGRVGDRSRRVLWIVEVDDYEEGEIQLNELYQFESGCLREKGKLKNREKLVEGSRCLCLLARRRGHGKGGLRGRKSSHGSKGGEACGQADGDRTFRERCRLTARCVYMLSHQSKVLLDRAYASRFRVQTASYDTTVRCSSVKIHIPEAPSSFPLRKRIRPVAL